VTYKYFGAPDRATAARVPNVMSRDDFGPAGSPPAATGGAGAGTDSDLLGDSLGMREESFAGLATKIKPETMSAIVLTAISGARLSEVPPLELVVLHPDYAVVQLPPSVVDPLRKAGEEELGAAAFVWSTVPDRRGPRDAYVIYRMLHEWQNFAHRCHESGHQLFCLVWP
jgi:hypothetical protein